MHRTSRAPHTLFAHARLMLREFIFIWDTPAGVSMLQAVTRVEHRRMTDWLRGIEQLVRSVVMWMALGLRLPAPRPAPPRGPRPKRLYISWPNRPDSWPTSFRMFPPVRFHVRRVRRERPFISRVIATRTLAWRLEAVRRVVCNPKPYAPSCARTLARLRAANVRANEKRDLEALILPDLPAGFSKGLRAAEPALGEARRRVDARIPAFFARSLDAG